MSQESTLISLGPISLNSHRNTTGLMLLPSKASFSGVALPIPTHPPTSSSPHDKIIAICLMSLFPSAY